MTTRSRERSCAATAAAGGDAGDERLLAFLVVVRALVRAKIDLLRAEQLGARPRRARVQEPRARGARRALRVARAAPSRRLRRGAGREREVDACRRAGRRLGAAGVLVGLRPQGAARARAAERAAQAQYAREVEPRGLRRARAARPRGLLGPTAVRSSTRRSATPTTWPRSRPRRAPQPAPTGSCATRRPRSCSSARAGARSRSTVSDADPALVGDPDRAAPAGGCPSPARRWPSSRPCARSRRLLDELAATLDARLARS